MTTEEELNKRRIYFIEKSYDSEIYYEKIYKIIIAILCVFILVNMLF
jgi:hypothetical protein